MPPGSRCCSAIERILSPSGARKNILQAGLRIQLQKAGILAKKIEQHVDTEIGSQNIRLRIPDIKPGRFGLQLLPLQQHGFPGTQEVLQVQVYVGRDLEFSGIIGSRQEAYQEVGTTAPAGFDVEVEYGAAAQHGEIGRLQWRKG